MGRPAVKRFDLEVAEPAIETVNRLESLLPPERLSEPESSISLAEVAPELDAEQQRREEKERRRAQRMVRGTTIGGD